MAANDDRLIPRDRNRRDRNRDTSEAYDDFLAADRPATTRLDPERLHQERSVWLAHVRRSVREPPRLLGMGMYFGRWAAPRPPWLKRSHPLSLFYMHRRRLLREGFVVWGAVVQANILCFQPGPMTHPAEFTYCIEPEADVRGDWLLEAASDLFALKGRQDLDGELQPIADHLADEQTASFGRRVPLSFINERPLALSSGLVFRRHLPAKHLTGRLVPLLVAPETPRVVLVVPSSFWPREMRQAWKRGEV